MAKVGWQGQTTRLFIQSNGKGRFLCLDYDLSILLHSYRLHYPNYFLIFAFFEFLSKDGILAWHIIRERKIVISSRFICLPFTFKRLFISFNIFREKILPTNLIEIPEMVDPPFWKQPDLIKSLADKLLLAPVDIPIVIIGLLVHAVG